MNVPFIENQKPELWLGGAQLGHGRVGAFPEETLHRHGRDMTELNLGNGLARSLRRPKRWPFLASLELPVPNQRVC